MPRSGSKFGVQINNHATVFTITTGSVTDTLTLPSPDFGDSEALEYTRVNKRTRGGDLIIFRASYWPKTRIYKKKWSDLSSEQRAKTLIFMRNHLGKQLTMLDHEGNTKTVVIRNPDADMGEATGGSNVIELQFEEV